MRTLIAEATVRRDTFTLEVDLRVEPGEVLGITGDLGSGKSSVLSLIGGRLQASEGIVAFGDEIWDQPSTSTFVSDRPISAMGQSYHHDLPEDLTGTEAIRRNVDRLNADEPDPEGVALRILDGLGITPDVAERLPWTFSGAETQRIALARALAPQAPVLLLDEPFGALDKRTGTAVREWLGEWLRHLDGLTILASTRVEHLDVLVDRIISLDV